MYQICVVDSQTDYFYFFFNQSNSVSRLVSFFFLLFLSSFYSSFSLFFSAFCFYLKVKGLFIYCSCFFRFFFKLVGRYPNQIVVGRKEEQISLQQCNVIILSSLFFSFIPVSKLDSWYDIYIGIFSINKMEVLLRILCIIARTVFLSFIIAISIYQASKLGHFLWPGPARSGPSIFQAHPVHSLFYSARPGPPGPAHLGPTLFINVS